jgi:hypothetical protein
MAEWGKTPVMLCLSRGCSHFSRNSTYMKATIGHPGFFLGAAIRHGCFLGAAPSQRREWDGRMGEERRAIGNPKAAKRPAIDNQQLRSDWQPATKSRKIIGHWERGANGTKTRSQ